jgi:hypothetical protein
MPNSISSFKIFTVHNPRQTSCPIRSYIVSGVETVSLNNPRNNQTVYCSLELCEGYFAIRHKEVVGANDLGRYKVTILFYGIGCFIFT